MSEEMKSETNCPELLDPRLALEPRKTRSKVARIVDFFITTDSVVAKATFVTDSPPLYVEVDWGDGKQDTIDHNFERLVQQQSTEPLPAGTYEFYHRYDVSYITDIRGGGGGFLRPAPQDYIVNLTVKDNDGGIGYRSEMITISPKYRVRIYRTYIGLKEGCDPFYDSFNDFTVFQFIDGELKNEWDWTASNDFFFAEPVTPLKGSQFSYDFEITDPLAFPLLYVGFTFIEVAKIYGGDTHITYTLPLYMSRDEEQYAERKSGVSLGECAIMYAVDYDINLLVPLPSNPNVLYAGE